MAGPKTGLNVAPSMADVARKAKVHQTTVSRALRNDRRLLEATRVRIQKIAKELGYRPHPLISTLIALRRSRHPPTHHATLAFIVQPGGSPINRRQYLAGAQAAAEKQGFAVEQFMLTEELNDRRLNGVLLARNIHGVIIGPLIEASGYFTLDWSEYCTTAIEFTFSNPIFDRVVHDSYSGMKMIMDECRRRGFKRVGLTLSMTGHERTQRANGAAYWMEQKTWKTFAPINPLFTEGWDTKAFAEWFKKNRPEVLVTSNELIPYIQPWLKERELVPGVNISLINVNALMGSGITGVFQNPFGIGGVAARMAIEKIINNDRGAPSRGLTILTAGQWFEGSTLQAAPS